MQECDDVSCGTGKKARPPTPASRSQKAAGPYSSPDHLTKRASVRLWKAWVTVGLYTVLQLGVFREDQPGTLAAGSPTGLGSYDHRSAMRTLRLLIYKTECL